MAMAQAFTPALLAHPHSALAPSASITCASARSFQRYPTRPLSLRNSPTSTLKIKSIPTIRGGACGGCRASMGLEALVFDCDGVILESEDLHRRAYNAAFEEFQVRSPSSAPEPLVWTPEFYDELQNTIGGGKPKMRWYFSRHGWPSSTILPNPPTTEEEQVKLIDTIQDWKTEKYKNFIGSGEVQPRPGVLELMDETRKKGLKLAVCSAATKSSVIFTLSSLLGKERFEALDCFLAGDDVDKKKPDPIIYIKASKALGVAPENCLVVEDSVIGLKAASGAGMACIISYTSSTSNQDFSDAKAVYPNLGEVRLDELMKVLEGTPISR